MPSPSLVVIFMIMVSHDIQIEALKNSGCRVKKWWNSRIFNTVYPLLSFVWMFSTQEWIKCNVIKTGFSWIIGILVRNLNCKWTSSVFWLMNDVKALAINHFFKLSIRLHRPWLFWWFKNLNFISHISRVSCGRALNPLTSSCSKRTWAENLVSSFRLHLLNGYVPALWYLIVTKFESLRLFVAHCSWVFNKLTIMPCFPMNYGPIIKLCPVTLSRFDRSDFNCADV